jgi:hypothetical protein
MPSTHSRFFPFKFSLYNDLPLMQVAYEENGVQGYTDYEYNLQALPHLKTKVEDGWVYYRGSTIQD